MGINLGGWLALEPFISPQVFQKYPEAVDEYTLSVAMAADTANGGLDQIEQHYDTFIVRRINVWKLRCSDAFARLSRISRKSLVCNLVLDILFLISSCLGAGLNFVRLALPFWAVGTWPGEPYLGGKGWL